MNNFQFVGRLTKDPEIRTNSKGTVCYFTIAVKRPFASKEADFFPCTAWRQQAEFISKHFKKGNRIAISGYMTSNKYTDSNGVEKIGYDWIVEDSEFCESKSDETQNATVTSPTVDLEENFVTTNTTFEIPF